MRAFLETMKGMVTTRRHAELSTGLSADVIAKYRKRLYGKKPDMQGLSDFALVYYGSPAELIPFIRLVDVSQLNDRKRIILLPQRGKTGGLYAVCYRSGCWNKRYKNRFV